MARFIYIYDTYCGWCYGAAPVVNALIDSSVDVTVMHRNLFQGTGAHRMGDGFSQMVLQYDRRIEHLTGQKFSDIYVKNILGNPDEILESSLTAQAAALVHDQGAKVEMALAHTLQKARYVDGISAVNDEIIRNALSEFNVKSSLHEGIEKAAQISAEAASLQIKYGIQGVPVLLQYQDGQTTQIDISTYYNLPEEIAALAA